MRFHEITQRAILRDLLADFPVAAHAHTGDMFGVGCIVAPLLSFLLQLVPNRTCLALQRPSDLGEGVSAVAQYLNFISVGTADARPFLFFISQIYALSFKSQRPGANVAFLATQVEVLS